MIDERVEPTRYLLVALVWSLAAVLAAPGAVAAFAAGVFILAWSGRLGPSLARTSTVYLGVLVVAAVALNGAFIGIPEVSLPELGVWLGVPALVAAYGAGLGIRGRSPAPVTAIVLVASLLATAGLVMAEHAGSDVGIDVYLAHRSAATALGDGENPYTDAVRYPDGSPAAEEGAVLEGYSYPPVTLWAYAAVTWSTGDPRWLNVVAWVGVVIAVLWRLYRFRPDWVVPFALVLAVAPGWRLMVFTGWTEPLTIALLAGAGFIWRRSPAGSGILLGLALASKQYMILLAPLLLLHRDPGQKRRLTTAALAGGATMVPYAVADFGVFFDRLVVRPLSLGSRPDTQSLPGVLDRVGLAAELPVLIAIGAALVVSWVVSRNPRGPDTFLVGTSFVLGAFFFLSLGFANYWFITAALVVIGSALPATAPPSVSNPRTDTR